MLTGGTVAEGNGYFYPPTVLADVPKSARLQKEEIFGPVAPLTAFETEDEAVGWRTTPSSAWSPTCSPTT